MVKMKFVETAMSGVWCLSKCEGEYWGVLVSEC